MGEDGRERTVERAARRGPTSRPASRAREREVVRRRTRDMASGMGYVPDARATEDAREIKTWEIHAGSAEERKYLLSWSEVDSARARPRRMFSAQGLCCRARVIVYNSFGGRLLLLRVIIVWLVLGGGFRRCVS